MDEKSIVEVKKKKEIFTIELSGSSFKRVG